MSSRLLYTPSLIDTLREPDQSDQSATLRSRLAIIAVGLLILLGYLLPTNWHLYPDSITACINVEQGAWIDMLHPHHLLLEPLLWLCWKIATVVSSDLSALDVWRAIGLISSLGALGVMSLILKRTGWGIFWCLLSLLLIASSWYYWLFGVTPSHYSLTVLCLMLIYQKLLACETAQDVQNAAPAIGLWLLIAILIHQIAILVLVPILGWTWWLSRGTPHPFTPLPLLRPLLLPAVATYSIGGMLATSSLEPFRIVHWLTTYGHYVQYWWWGTLPEGESPFRYWLSLLASSHRDLLWADPSSAYMRLMCDSGRVIQETTAPFPQWWWTHINPLLTTAGNSLLGILGLWLILSLIILWKREDAQRDRLVLALLWCAPFVVFHAFYCVQDGWFRIYYLLPLLWILLAPAVHATSQIWRRTGAAMAGCIFAFTLLNNFANGLTLWRHPVSNVWLQDIAEVQALDGWLVFGGAGLNYTYTVYAQAFCDKPFYQAEMLDLTDMPPHASFPTPDLPARLYLDGRLFNDIPEEALSAKVLHLGWSNAAQSGPKELWIPLQQLRIEQTVYGGRYQLLRATVLDSRP